MSDAATRLWRLLDLVELAAALQKARDLTGQLSETHSAIRRYADEHLHASSIVTAFRGLFAEHAEPRRSG